MPDNFSKTVQFVPFSRQNNPINDFNDSDNQSDEEHNYRTSEFPTLVKFNPDMIRPSHNLIEDENYYANTRTAVAAVQDIGIQHLISTYNSTTQSSGIKSRRKDEGHSLLLIEEANLIFKEAR